MAEYKVFGVWNDLKKQWQFQNCNAQTAKECEKKLFKKIGNDIRKHRFQILEIKKQNKKLGGKKMGLIAKSVGNGIDFEPIPEGVHIARCVALIDLGMQYEEKFDKIVHKAIITWELVDEIFKDAEGVEKCRTMSKEFSLSLNAKSNLTKVLEAWRGCKFTDEELAGFDLNKILGKPCQIQVIHTTKGDKTYSNIAAIMALPKGMKVDAPTSTLVYDLDDEKSVENIVQLPEWIQKKVMESVTWKEKNKGTVSVAQENHDSKTEDLTDNSDSDFPF